MTDPFRAELTVEYLAREYRGWAADARLARSTRPRASLGALFAGLASRLVGEVTPQPRPEVPMLSRRERPAA
jgi:hypothetical protein